MLSFVKKISKCVKKRILIIKGDRKRIREVKIEEKTESIEEDKIESIEEESNGINDEVWIAEPDEGVLLILVRMPNRFNKFKGIRFSKKHFNHVEAEQWWADNYSNIMELWTIDKENPLPETLGFGEESDSPIIEEEANDKTTLLINEDDSTGVSVNCMPDGYKEVARVEMSGEMLEKRNKYTLDLTVCSSESDADDCYGLSCHTKCAIQTGTARVVDHDQCLKLDRSYCCAACINVSGTIGCRKQLANGTDVQRLFSIAIEKADEWVSSNSNSNSSSDSYELYRNVVKHKTTESQQEPSCVVSRIMDLNADVIAPAESSAEEENELARPNGIEDINEYCLKVIRRLDCRGHIEKDFRVKFLTWFCLRSTEQERKVVISFMCALEDEPSSLASQLIDLFSEIVSCKRSLKKSFCSKLWHSICSAFLKKCN